MKKITRNLSSLLALSAIFIISAVSADLIASIDCGSSDLAYTDPDNSIIWLPDNDYISTGDSEVVQSSNSFSHVMDSLRVFTSRNKNCYQIPVDRGTKILARARFYYGNYDQKSKPPAFNLQFDGNDWADVQTTMDSALLYEVIYVVKGDSTSICLAQTVAGQYPFINTLEIRSLVSTMYSDGNVDDKALFLRRRVAYGTNDTIRFPDDPYDRIWTPSPGGNGLIPAATESPSIVSSGLDQPPQLMLQNAVTVPNVTDNIQLGAVFPVTKIPVYVNMYFSEVVKVDTTTDKRSFTVYQDNDAISETISPPFGDFAEFNFNNVMVNVNTTFYLVADNDSTLPPLVNGMEIFYISDPLTKGTNSDDVEGLSALQTKFEVLQEWSGDPCLPAPYSWDWVNCSLDATPRITALYLSGFGLSGELPDISSMDGLDTIDLQNNSLSGSIPDFLGSLSNLKKLNLADNKFSGPIPASLSKKNNLNLVVSPGNPGLCTADQKSCKTTKPPATSGSPAVGNSSKKKSSSKLPIILGVIIPVAVIIWAVICVFLILHFKRKRAIVSTVNPAGQNGGINGQGMGKVGMAAFNAFGSNENAETDNNTTSTDHNETA